MGIKQSIFGRLGSEEEDEQQQQLHAFLDNNNNCRKPDNGTSFGSSSFAKSRKPEPTLPVVKPTNDPPSLQIQDTSSSSSDSSSSPNTAYATPPDFQLQSDHYSSLEDEVHSTTTTWLQKPPVTSSLMESGSNEDEASCHIKQMDMIIDVPSFDYKSLARTNTSAMQRGSNEDEKSCHIKQIDVKLDVSSSDYQSLARTNTFDVIDSVVFSVNNEENEAEEVEEAKMINCCVRAKPKGRRKPKGENVKGKGGIVDFTVFSIKNEETGVEEVEKEKVINCHVRGKPKGNRKGKGKKVKGKGAIVDSAVLSIKNEETEVEEVEEEKVINCRIRAKSKGRRKGKGKKVKGEGRINDSAVFSIKNEENEVEEVEEEKVINCYVRAKPKGRRRRKRIKVKGKVGVIDSAVFSIKNKENEVEEVEEEVINCCVRAKQKGKRKEKGKEGIIDSAVFTIKNKENEVEEVEEEVINCCVRAKQKGKRKGKGKKVKGKWVKNCLVDQRNGSDDAVNEDISIQNDQLVLNSEAKVEEEKEIKCVVDEGKWIKHYHSSHKTLLVGEGDFSFSASLALAFGSASNMIATSLNSRRFLKKNYGNAMVNIKNLMSMGCLVMHGIDATQIADHTLLGCMVFDRIIFNFPFAGFFSGLSRDEELRKHRRLVSLFLKNAKRLIGGLGEIHISHKTNGFHKEWNLQNIASSHGLRLIKAAKFNQLDYLGYNTKCGFGGDNNFNCKPAKTYKFGLK